MTYEGLRETLSILGMFHVVISTAKQGACYGDSQTEGFTADSGNSPSLVHAMAVFSAELILGRLYIATREAVDI